MNRKKPNHAEPRDVNRKIKKHGLFYKISFFLLLLSALVLSYFVVLVSSKPKSFPYVTKKITTELKKNFGDDSVSLENSYISFTRYGTFKIAVSNLKILYPVSQNSLEKQVFLIPKIESEISLLNLILMRFWPKKIKIISPSIVIDDLSQEQEKQDLADEAANDNDHISLIAGALSSIQKKGFEIQDIEIENANLLIRGLKFDTEVLLKKSQISIKKHKKNFQISSSNRLTFDKDKSDVYLNSNCELHNNSDLKCELSLENFVVNSISEIHPSLRDLEKINSTLNAKANFAFGDGKIGNIAFQINAKRGDFNFSNFFNGKIEFNNFSLLGEYDHNLKILDIFDVRTNLVSHVKNKDGNFLNPHLTMSMLVSNLGNDQNKKFDFSIKLQNVLNAELERFWPKSLDQNDVRSWVFEHIKGGVIKNSYAKFSILQNGTESTLGKIDSEVIFSGFNLKYDDYFPEIRDISGVAHFNENSMKVSVASGEVLNSKIFDSLVLIDDFSAPITTLKILGKTKGHAADAFRHVDYRAEFSSEVKKYLNGNSQNDFEIRLPISIDPTLKNSYIAINSTTPDFENPYVKGGVMINCKKEVGSTNFIVNADLTTAELTAKAFDIVKNRNVESGLDFIVAVADPKKVQIKNISLWKKEEVEEEKIQKKSRKKSAEIKEKITKIVISKVKGNLVLETAPFALSSLDLTNDNFGKNSYGLTYKFDPKTSTQKISLKGQSLNVAALIEGKFFKASGDDKIKNTQIQVAVNEAVLLRNKLAKNLYFSLNCSDGFCYSGILRANYGKKQLITLAATKRPKQKIAEIEGRIFDVGFFAESLGISNVVLAGDAKVKVQNKMIAGKQVLDGEILINNDITIFENATVKRISKNDLFSKIKDKIFSSEKTTFNSVKLNFDIQGNILNIKSLIANNYKIGITAKGFIDLKNNTYQINGMIIPGFVVNSLFGIGKIPLIGGVISGILTGGEGGGVFGLKYSYVKKKGQADGVFETNKVAAFVPATIQNLFD